MGYTARLYALLLASLVLLLLALACASTSPAPDSPGTVVAPSHSPLSWTPEPDPARTQGTPVTAQAQDAPRAVEKRVSAPALNCLGSDFIKRVSAEYAVNPLRAERTYIDQRVCLRGVITSFHKAKADPSSVREKYGSSVVAAVGNGATFSLTYAYWNKWSSDNWTNDEPPNSKGLWEEWILARDVGDVVEAECTISRLTTKSAPGRSPGTPLFSACLRVADGVPWAPPTPTPMPPPLCKVWEYGGPSYIWLNIDCPAGEVTVGIADHRDWFNEPQPILGRSSLAIAFYFALDGEIWSDDRYGPHSPWEQWDREPRADGSVEIMWRAPSAVAASIISGWQRQAYDTFLLVAFGECCGYMNFDLTEPPTPASPRWPEAASPTPGSVPTSASPRAAQPAYTPVAASAPAPTPTPTPTPSPTSTLEPAVNGSPLIAAFEDVPTSHNGDAIRFRLRFSEPVSTSYKVLRDVAIQVEGGTVKESKRVDGRSDLWRVTIEPDGNADLAVSLTAPAGCDDAAAVCTDAGKVLSNEPTVTIPYRN